MNEGSGGCGGCLTIFAVIVVIGVVIEYWQIAVGIVAVAAVIALIVLFTRTPAADTQEPVPSQMPPPPDGPAFPSIPDQTAPDPLDRGNR